MHSGMGSDMGYDGLPFPLLSWRCPPASLMSHRVGKGRAAAMEVGGTLFFQAILILPCSQRTQEELGGASLQPGVTQGSISQQLGCSPCSLKEHSLASCTFAELSGVLGAREFIRATHLPAEMSLRCH